jgi:hypothetical protein
MVGIIHHGNKARQHKQCDGLAAELGTLSLSEADHSMTLHTSALCGTAAGISDGRARQGRVRTARLRQNGGNYYENVMFPSIGPLAVPG